MTGSSTQGIKTVLHPVSDLAAKAVYAALRPDQTQSAGHRQRLTSDRPGPRTHTRRTPGRPLRARQQSPLILEVRTK